MNESEKRTRRAASYPGAIAWIAANAENEAIQADPDVWARFVSDVFKRPIEEVNVALNTAVKANQPTSAPTQEVTESVTETVDA